MSDVDSTAIEYRTISRFPGYRFGDDGSVWSCFTRGVGRKTIGTKWRRLTAGAYGRAGHQTVQIAGKHGSVHRLILEAFIGPCPPGMQCRHINGDPTDNRLANLAWGTHQQNMDDMVRHGTQAYGERHGCSVLTEGNVKEIRTRLYRGDAHTAIARDFGVTATAIHHINTGKNWKHVD